MKWKEMMRANQKKIAGHQSVKVSQSASLQTDIILTPLVAKKVLSQHKVRTSLQDRTLDSMILVTEPSRTNSNEPATAIRLRDIKESSCHLASVIELRRLATKRTHHGGEVVLPCSDQTAYTQNADLTEIIKKHTFVGVIDLPRCLTLIQHNKNLYMVNHAALACVHELLRRFELTQHHREEMFYQLALLQFGDYSRLRLDPPPSLRMLVKLAVEVEDGTERSGMSKDEIVNVCVRF